MPEKQLIRKVVTATLERTRSYLAEEFGIEVNEITRDRGDIEMLAIHDMTAIVGVGGPVNLLVAFSFERRLADVLYERMTDGIDVEPGEEDLYRGSVVAEIVNTVIGNCTADFQQSDQRISLTPPVVLDQTKRIQRMKNATFISRTVHTDFGCLDINLVGPTELFDDKLDYVD
jgi:CheY-specific phosphatase CheX